VLIKLCEREDVNIQDFIESIKIKFKVSDYSSSYAAMVTSKYLLKKMECNLAQFFAVLALKYKQDDDSSFMFWENLKMVNWFKNNSSDIKVGSSIYGF
jgi:D-alanine-D-alanine ligase-like ATP-grasp enzyme